MIELVSYGDLDRKAYDRCVNHSESFRIYGTSDYLDAVTEQWDALVYKDYQAVMPVPRRRKYGLAYVYTPTFVQQLGVFSSEAIDTRLEREFCSRLVSSFFLVDYALHSQSRPQKGWEERTNYALDLGPGYEELFQGFNTNRQRVVRKGFGELVIEKSPEPGYFMEQLNRSDLGFAPDISMLETLKRLIEQNPGHVRIWSANFGDSWVGGLVWLRDHKRITYLFPVASKTGRTLQVSSYLLDSLIRDHQGSGLLLDLEGSMLPGVARFYKSFGARKETYYFMKSRLYGLF